jgi:predicted transcriptional regulator
MRWLVKLLRAKSKAQNVQVGELLEIARKEAGMTQTQAAARVARDQSFIARVESGLQQPTFVEVEQLAEAYGKQLADFQTIKTIEQSNRNFVVAPNKIAEYSEFLSERQKQRRGTKSYRPPKRSRRGGKR